MRNARVRGRDTLGAAVLWALVYNALWGLAWFGFMRGEWARAAVPFSGVLQYSQCATVLTLVAAGSGQSVQRESFGLRRFVRDQVAKSFFGRV